MTVAEEVLHLAARVLVFLALIASLTAIKWPLNKRVLVMLVAMTSTFFARTYFGGSVLNLVNSALILMGIYVLFTVFAEYRRATSASSEGG